MKPYLVSLAAGLLVGVIYGCLNVRSPAPPVIALVGLLGILLGEQIPPLVRHALAGRPAETTSVRGGLANHMFGRLPTRPGRETPADQQQAAVVPRRPETTA